MVFFLFHYRHDWYTLQLATIRRWWCLYGKNLHRWISFSSHFWSDFRECYIIHTGLATERISLRRSYWNFMSDKNNLWDLSHLGSVVLFKTKKQILRRYIILQWQEQGRPPAWTQEAYCPLRSKCSFCCPIWGVPPPILTWPGDPILGCRVPHHGVPLPLLTWPGYPPPQKGHGTGGSIMGWRWGNPQKEHGTSGSIMG